MVTIFLFLTVVFFMTPVGRAARSQRHKGSKAPGRRPAQISKEA